MTQPDYKFYKNKIFKYLVNNYVIVKNKLSYTSLIKAKYKIVSKDNNDEIPAIILLDDIKNIFGVDDTEAIKKILRYWSKNKLSEKNWFKWRLKTPSMDFMYQPRQIVGWDHNIDFNPRIGISSRYSSVNLNERLYCGIDVSRPVEDLQIIDVRIRPIVPVQHIDLNITINNE
jgi:hypothetical protein